MLPIGDENLRGRGLPYVTLAIIAINFAIFVLFQLPSDRFTYGFSAVPFEITHNQDLVRAQLVVIDGQRTLIPQAPGPSPIQLTLLTSMFMHGGWAHILGNMLFLWIFGDNIEFTLGRLPYLAFYLVAGIAAAFTQIAASPNSVIPTLGASGAIAGVLGCYIVLYPRNRVTVLVIRFLTQVPAVVVLGIWAVIQVFSGFGQIAVSDETAGGGVAYLAHVGGFATGVLVGFVARGLGLAERAQGFSSRQIGWR